MVVEGRYGFGKRLRRVMPGPMRSQALQNMDVLCCAAVSRVTFTVCGGAWGIEGWKRSNPCRPVAFQTIDEDSSYRNSS